MKTAAVLHAEPRALIVNAIVPELYLTIVCFHAPGFDREPSACNTRWTDFKRTVERHRKRNSQLVLVGDANARLGQCESIAVVFCGAEAANEARELFDDALQSLDLCCSHVRRDMDR